MPLPVQTDDLDELERTDLEEELDADTADDDTAGPIAIDPLEDAVIPQPELPPEIEEEIKKAQIPEADLDAKPKGQHIIPPEIIHKPLEPDDLYDEDGTI